MIGTAQNETHSYFTEKYNLENKLPALPPTPSPSQSSVITVKTSFSDQDSESNETICLDEYSIPLKLDEKDLQISNEDSEAYILAQIERQNVLLEKDPKSICIQSNKIKAHYSTMQKLVKDNAATIEDEDVDWGFWDNVIQDPDQVASRMPHLFSLKLRAGIPPRVRGLIWQAMSKSASLNLETVYDQLCKQKSPHERIIQRDLSRTFPRIDMFKKENGRGQSSMRRILEAYSLYDTDVGYCQGLGFLVGPLLLNMSETQSFCVFVRLMETYEMRSMFTLNMEGLQLRLYQFTQLLKDILPNLAQHLDQHGIHTAMYASQWFLTLFAYVFPMDLVNRIYDIVFAEGATETIMRVAIAMLKRSEYIILFETNTEFEDILDFLTSRKLCEPYGDNFNSVIHDAMALSNTINKERLNRLTEAYNLKPLDGPDEVVATTAGRFGFWRRRKRDNTSDSIRLSEVNARPASVSSASAFLAKSSQNGTVRLSTLTKRWSSVSSHKDWGYNKTSTFKASAKVGEIKTLEQVLAELEELKKVHQQTLNELAEAKCDKQDLECERGALKLTITELERCRQKEEDRSSTGAFDGLDPACGKKEGGMAYSDHVCKEAVTQEFLGTMVYPLPPLIDTLNPSFKTMLDETNCPTVSENSSSVYNQRLVAQIELLEEQNFELKTKYSALTHDLMLVRTKFDTVNEGQILMADKISTMRASMETLLREKKEQEKESLSLKLQNEKLQSELNKLRAIFTNTFTSANFRNSVPNNKPTKTNDRRNGAVNIV